MSADRGEGLEQRVLLLVPTRRDAEITCAMLVSKGLSCIVCDSASDLGEQVQRGAATVLTTEDALSARDIDQLLAVLAKQPPWSDIPIVILMRGGATSPTASRVLRALNNVTVLERPAPMRSVLSAVEAAFRARKWQYQLRDQFDALRESQARFRAMANSIPQLAWMARPDGWVFWYNQRWHDYCGTTNEQVEGWKWQSIHDPQELPRVIEKWKAAVAAGEPWEDTFPLRRHDGEFRWHLSRARPFRDGSNSIILWFGTNTDITDERNRAQEREALLKSEQAARGTAERASRMKDEFLATLSHELRTPLNAILGWSQLLRREKQEPIDKELLEEGLAVIERNTRVQTQLIEDLLDMSRIISGKIRLDVQTVEAATFINAAIETVMPAANAKGVKLQKVLDANAGPLSGDPNRLQQVIWNLLSNAIKFTPRGGRVQVVLEPVNSHIEISVSDTGQGIPSDFLPHVFERFRQADASTTRKFGGLGLGLAIVKQMVELHGGTITAKSPGENQGSTFTVMLPVKVVHRDDSESSRVHPRATQFPPLAADCTSLKGLKVLVVDDEADARILIKRLLEDCKAVVSVAGSAAEALRLVEAERPNVLVTDIGMPDVDGYELLRRVRALGAQRGGKVPAIALTAFARTEDRTRALLAGFNVHVSKPVEPQELVATVASVGGMTGELREAESR